MKRGECRSGRIKKAHGGFKTELNELMKNLDACDKKVVRSEPGTGCGYKYICENGTGNDR